MLYIFAALAIYFKHTEIYGEKENGNKKLITNKVEHINRRNGIRHEVIILFWKKLQNLNDTFVQAMIAVGVNSDLLFDELENCYLC